MAVDSSSMGRKLRCIREEKHMTQKDFASKLNISQQTLSRYENGKNIIPYEELISIITKFDISMEYMFEIECHGITSEERRIIDYFRNINDSLKPNVKALLQKMMEEFPRDICSTDITKDENKD